MNTNGCAGFLQKVRKVGDATGEVFAEGRHWKGGIPAAQVGFMRSAQQVRDIMRGTQQVRDFFERETGAGKPRVRWGVQWGVQTEVSAGAGWR